MKGIGICVAALLLAGCNASAVAVAEEPQTLDEMADQTAAGAATEGAFGQQASVETYGSSAPLTFGDNQCIDDCSGHEAGYDWAEERGITDADDCGGKSQSFIEGCETYADENGG